MQSLLTSAPFAAVFLYGLIHVFRIWQTDVKALLAEQERVRSALTVEQERVRSALETEIAKVRDATQVREDARNREWVDFLRQLVDDGRREDKESSHDAPTSPRD